MEIVVVGCAFLSISYQHLAANSVGEAELIDAHMTLQLCLWTDQALSRGVIRKMFLSKEQNISKYSFPA
jgi:hypothetical protein